MALRGKQENYSSRRAQPCSHAVLLRIRGDRGRIAQGKAKNELTRVSRSARKDRGHRHSGGESYTHARVGQAAERHLAQLLRYAWNACDVARDLRDGGEPVAAQLRRRCEPQHLRGTRVPAYSKGVGS